MKSGWTKIIKRQFNTPRSSYFNAQISGRRAALNIELLRFGIAKRKDSILEHLINYPDFDVLDEEGKTALHLASHFGEDFLVKTLIENGANIYKADINGKTAAHLSVNYANINSLSLLLLENCKLTSSNPNLENIYDIKDNYNRRVINWVEAFKTSAPKDVKLRYNKILDMLLLTMDSEHLILQDEGKFHLKSRQEQLLKQYEDFTNLKDKKFTDILQYLESDFYQNIDKSEKFSWTAKIDDNNKNISMNLR